MKYLLDSLIVTSISRKQIEDWQRLTEKSATEGITEGESTVTIHFQNGLEIASSLLAPNGNASSMTCQTTILVSLSTACPVYSWMNSQFSVFLLYIVTGNHF